MQRVRIRRYLSTSFSVKKPKHSVALSPVFLPAFVCISFTLAECWWMNENWNVNALSTQIIFWGTAQVAVVDFCPLVSFVSVSYIYWLKGLLGVFIQAHTGYMSGGVYSYFQSLGHTGFLKWNLAECLVPSVLKMSADSPILASLSIYLYLSISKSVNSQYCNIKLYVSFDMTGVTYI